MSTTTAAPPPPYPTLPNTRPRCDVAVEAALAGWQVHPCRHESAGSKKAKEPLLLHGHLDASDDPAVVAAWWAHWPLALVGIRMGDGVVLLDFDTDPGKGLHAPTQESAAQAKVGTPLPPTFTLPTARGGYHRYFRTPLPVRSRAPALDILGFDTRGEGGYSIIHGDVVPDLDAMATLPAAYLDPAHGLLWAPAKPPVAPPAPDDDSPITPDPETTRLIKAHLSTLTPPPLGQRHEQVLKMARLIGGYVGANRIDYATAKQKLDDACADHSTSEDPSRTADSLRAVIDGLSHGMSSPIYPTGHVPPDISAAAAVHLLSAAAAVSPPSAVAAAALNGLPDPHHDGSDASNAHLLIHLMATDYRFVREFKEWAQWASDQGRWVLGGGAGGSVHALANLVKDHHLSRASTLGKPGAIIYHRSASLAGHDAMVTYAQRDCFPEVSASAESFDQAVGNLNIGGQTVVLPLNAPPYVRPACKQDYLTRASPTPYDPKAQCPRFERFILEVMNDDPSHAAYLQRTLGYALSGYCTEQKMFFMQGHGGNGKGVLQRAISNALGSDYCTAGAAETFIEKRNDGGIPADLASFRGTRFVFPAELSDSRKLDSALLKTCTGQDTIKARKMRENFSEYIPQFNLFFSANPGYRIDVSDAAMRRRFVVIPFDRSFVANPDHTLDASLRAEAPGIVQWLIRGFDLYRQHGLSPPPGILSATAEVVLSGDLVQQFLDEQVSTHPPRTGQPPLSNGRLYEVFQKWCVRNGQHPMTQGALSQKLKSKGHEQGRTNAARFWPTLYELLPASTPAAFDRAPGQVPLNPIPEG